ncbi:MAG TPA: hypothetical protein VFX59_08860 [Polyangiales bacterium]|nr:hypothetical protein [Polyangiales bacterium]
MNESVLYALMGTGAAVWLAGFVAALCWAWRRPRRLALALGIAALGTLVVVLFRRQPEVCTVVLAGLIGAGAAALTLRYIARRPGLASVVITALAGGLAC